MVKREKIVVLDFGSQYAHLIAKRFRLMGYYSEIALPSCCIESISDAKGIVLSGGPSSVYEKNIPQFNEKIFDLPIPILGTCYGHQLMAKHYGAKVEKADIGEFGFARLLQDEGSTSPLLNNVENDEQVWMSHQDEVVSVPDGFEKIAYTKDCRFAALQNVSLKRFSLQFHAEVKDSLCGDKIFENFAKICSMKKNWNQDAVLQAIGDDIKATAHGKKVLLFLSGGVDSTVAFALLNNTLGQERVLGLHIDNGFMRKDESTIIAKRYRDFGFNNFIVEDASTTFLKAVENLTDPQEKRHAVGETFIHVRDEVIKKLNLNEDEWLLGQGTLYPDIIESGGTENSHVIKTHHNRVEGIQALIEKGLIIEPLKDLYKDEVRVVGKKLGLSDELVYRHPFPGPGLSINVLCANQLNEKENSLELANAIQEYQNLDMSHLGLESFQRNILPVKSVGVQGDFRTYRFPAVIHFNKNSFPTKKTWEDLEKASSYITNSLNLVNRTVLCMYEKDSCTLQKGYCTKDRLDITREVDAIVLEELKSNGLYNTIFQHLTICIPYGSSANSCSIVLRPVVSEDVMTARFAHLDARVLEKIVQKIESLCFIDALYYDITNKPPATFGWE